MYSQNLTVLDLRNTLPNLKTLVLSLSHGEWSEEYAKASLRPEGLFAEAEEERPNRFNGANAEVGEESFIDGEGREGESSNSSGSTESTSEPSTTPETSIEALPPREDAETTSSSVATRSRSSSLASAASTVRPNRSDSPTSSSPSKNRIKRSSSRDSKSSSAASTQNGGGGGIEKRPPSASQSSSPVDDDVDTKPTLQAVEAVKVKLEDGKRKRKESGGSSYGSRFWSAVAGKAGERAHSHRSDRTERQDGAANTANGGIAHEGEEE
jgi:hypothetical protein